MIDQPINNRGDESAHKALVKSILQAMPNMHIQVLFVRENQDGINQFKVCDARVTYINITSDDTSDNIFDRFFYKIARFCPVFLKLHSVWKKIIPFYKDADIILCAPGGINMGGFQSWRHLMFLLLAKYMRKPIAYYGRSIGPFPVATVKNRLFKKKSLELLHYFSFLSLRDKKSMDLADSLGVIYVPTLDSAFLESPKVDVPQNISNLIGTKPYIIFVPNKLNWHFLYKRISLERILNFYKRLLDVIVSKYPDHNIVMLPQTFNFDDKTRGDINFFRDFKQYSQCEKIIIIPDTCSSDIQQTIISKADCMIGARYHSVVFAINQAISFVALSYEHKIYGLADALHKTESVVDITRAFESEESMNGVVAQFFKALNFANKDVDAQIKAKKMAKKCFDELVSFLQKN